MNQCVLFLTDQHKIGSTMAQCMDCWQTVTNFTDIFCEPVCVEGHIRYIVATQVLWKFIFILFFFLTVCPPMCSCDCCLSVLLAVFSCLCVCAKIVRGKVTILVLVKSVLQSLNKKKMITSNNKNGMKINRK